MHTKEENLYNAWRITPEFCDFFPIDAEPYINYHSKRIEDKILFRRVDPNAKQILVEPATLSEVLDIALSKQRSAQEKIHEAVYYNQRNKNIEIKNQSDTAAQLRLVA